MESDELYQDLLTVLLDQGSISKSEALSAAEGSETEFANLFLDVHLDEGRLRIEETQQETRYYLEDREWAVSMADSISTGLDDESAEIDDLDDAVVVNVPSQMFPDFARLREEYSELPILRLRTAFARIFSQTESIGRWIVPYFEYSGIESLEDEFEAVAKRDADLRLLTRGVLDGGASGSYAEKIRGLKLLLDKYQAHSSSGSIQLREFEHRIGPETREFHYMGIHQKLLIADRTVAYTGSGEIRRGSLQLNGEAGQITTEEQRVSFWADYFDLFWKRSTPISEDFLTSQL